MTWEGQRPDGSKFRSLSWNGGFAVFCRDPLRGIVDPDVLEPKDTFRSVPRVIESLVKGPDGHSQEPPPPRQACGGYVTSWDPESGHLTISTEPTTP